MNIRLGRMPCAIGWLFCALIVVAETPFAVADTPSSGQIARLVQQLGAENFEAREAAAAQLVSAGEAAAGPLVDSICNDGPEMAWRSASLLQQIALGGDAATYAKIIDALRLENNRRSDKLAALISNLTAQRATHRRQMAHERIRAFGGRFGGDEPVAPLVAATQTDVPLPEPPPDLPPEGADRNATTNHTPTLIADAYVSPLVPTGVVDVPRSESLTIDENWLGGDEGLTSLCDLPELSALNLSRAPLTDAALDTIAQMPAIQSLEIEDMRFSSAAITKFRTRQPRTRVVARSSKLLDVRVER